MTVMRPALALGLLLAAAVAAKADPSKPPNAEYTATSTLTEDGRTIATHKVAYSKGRLRTEESNRGILTITIVDGPAKRTTVIYAATRTFEQWDHDGSDPGAPMAGQTVTVEKQGEEAVGGIPATKNKISGKSTDGKDIAMTVWTSKENIQLKMSGTDTVDGKQIAIGMELKDVKIGPVDEKQFAVPAGYRRVPGTPAPGQPAPPAPPKK
jgi:hypothetical protein